MKIKTDQTTGKTTIEFEAAELMGLHEEMRESEGCDPHARPAIQEFLSEVAKHMDEEH